MKKVLLCLGFILCIFGAKNVYAADFSSKYNVTYTFRPDGKTDVVQNITVINLVPEYYLSKYTIDLGPQIAVDAVGKEKNRELRTSLIQNASSSALTVEFPDKTVGKGSSRSFSITYTSENTLQKSGNLKSINIPKVAGQGISEYKLTLNIPREVGKVSSIIPTPDSKEEQDDQTVITFTEEQLTKSPVTISIGTEQYYTLGLTYHLKNPQNRSVYTEIALPMNTPYQKILYDNISPKPRNISVDEDGNYIARYMLLPRQELDVQFSGKAIVYTNKQYEEKALTPNERFLYTAKQKYWETDEIDIATTAAKLRTPEAIYQYVVKTLSYDTTKLGSQDFIRKGALIAMQQPDKSVCMEFTDLFVALARAAGIPAREINGYAYTNDPVSRPVSLNQDVLHSWPEYYDDKKGWIQIDPTWENTTKGVDYYNSFDLNHIAFVRKGTSSEYPYPAGSYKNEHTDTRDVLVSLTETMPEIQENFELISPKKQTVFAGNKLELAVTIKNTGNTPLHYNVQKAILDNEKTTRNEDAIIVPPFSEAPIVLAAYKTKTSDDNLITGSVIVQNKTAQAEAQITPWFKSIWVYLAILYGIGIPILCVVLYKNLHQKTLQKKNMV